MATSFTRIPTIDLSLASSPTTLPTLLADLRHALIDIGFLYISNHGVPSSVITDLVTALPDLFNLTPEEKRAVALENSPHFLGYSGVGSESTGGKVDQREQYEFATELSATWHEGLPLAERLRGPNQWPKNDPALRRIIQTYLTSLTHLSTHFLSLVALCLSLPAHTFHHFLSDQHRLKLVHYPIPSHTSSQGVGPHKDSSGWWTFLLQASPEAHGLQVLNKSGHWIDVPPVPDTFVVNIGQAFEVVTNGLCKATTHRVRSGQVERYSVPFFQGVRRDLTRGEASGTLKGFFDGFRSGGEEGGMEEGRECEEGREIDSPFLMGRYDTWGEAQLRTKVRSHRENGRRFYAEVYERFVNDDVM
ncbi:2OG-Fe(II) oxygenase superfamily protein [Xylariaceae sp. FL1019]|nr:2OG-Fe(II) oxygenase superfamily protein [Xylariaceae sp. FL1019]